MTRKYNGGILNAILNITKHSSLNRHRHQGNHHHQPFRDYQNHSNDLSDNGQGFDSTGGDVSADGGFGDTSGDCGDCGDCGGDGGGDGG